MPAAPRMTAAILDFAESRSLASKARYCKAGAGIAIMAKQAKPAPEGINRLN